MLRVMLSDLYWSRNVDCQKRGQSLLLCKAPNIEECLTNISWRRERFPAIHRWSSEWIQKKVWGSFDRFGVKLVFGGFIHICPKSTSKLNKSNPAPWKLMSHSVMTELRARRFTFSDCGNLGWRNLSTDGEERHQNASLRLQVVVSASLIARSIIKNCLWAGTYQWRALCRPARETFYSLRSPTFRFFAIARWSSCLKCWLPLPSTRSVAPLCFVCISFRKTVSRNYGWN